MAKEKDLENEELEDVVVDNDENEEIVEDFDENEEVVEDFDEEIKLSKEEKRIKRDKEKAEKRDAKVKAKAEKYADKESKRPVIETDYESGAKVRLIATALICMLLLGGIAFLTNQIIHKANTIKKNPTFEMVVENFGTIKGELYPEYAPNTVANFIKLAQNGFYNGKTFHRTIPDFMIQGGDPNGDGTGGATLDKLDSSKDGEAYSIKGEFVLNGFTQNSLKHEKGVLSMARSDYSSLGKNSITKEGYNSGSCQFFIMNVDNTSIDGQYAAFGRVTEGLDIVDKIANVEVETRETNSEDTSKTADKPVNPPKITSLTVETYGVDYGMPETQKPFDYYSYMMQQYYNSSNVGGTSGTYSTGNQ